MILTCLCALEKTFSAVYALFMRFEEDVKHYERQLCVGSLLLSAQLLVCATHSCGLTKGALFVRTFCLGVHLLDVHNTTASLGSRWLVWIRLRSTRHSWTSATRLFETLAITHARFAMTRCQFENAVDGSTGGRQWPKCTR